MQRGQVLLRPALEKGSIVIKLVSSLGPLYADPRLDICRPRGRYMQRLGSVRGNKVVSHCYMPTFSLFIGTKVEGWKVVCGREDGGD